MSSVPYDHPEISGRVWSDQESEKVEEITTIYPITMTKTNYGFSLYTIDGDDHVGGNLRRLGFWEPETTNWLLNNVQEADTCLDIGMNIGYFTEIMARKVGPFGRVFSFEANKELVNVYEKTINESDNDYEAIGSINLFDIGLSNETQEAYLRFPNNNYGGAGIEYEKQVFDGYITLPVFLDRIDNILDDISINEIDIIKMDVEGHEEKIWDTLEKPLKSCRAAIVELGPYHSEEFLNKVSSQFNMFKLVYDQEVAIGISDIKDAPSHLNIVLRPKS
jgi:FkbM family methyltransferase